MLTKKKRITYLAPQVKIVEISNRQVLCQSYGKPTEFEEYEE